MRFCFCLLLVLLFCGFVWYLILLVDSSCLFSIDCLFRNLAYFWYVCFNSVVIFIFYAVLWLLFYYFCVRFCLWAWLLYLFYAGFWVLVCLFWFGFDYVFCLWLLCVCFDSVCLICCFCVWVLLLFVTCCFCLFCIGLTASLFSVVFGFLCVAFVRFALVCFVMLVAFSIFYVQLCFCCLLTCLRVFV